MSLEDSDLPAGSRIAGRYVIERLLRRTPRSAIYLARVDTAQTSRFCVRVIAAPTVSPDAVSAVHRELQRVAMLRQRAVPALLAVTRDEDRLVIVTERPDGITLRELLQKNGRLKSGELGRLVTELATVLDAMHTASPPFLHRGLSPDAISVGDRLLRVWIEGCGLVHALAQQGVFPADAADVPTAYRSPGDLEGRASAGGDVFALASLAYECLTGRPAHEAANDEETRAIVLRGPRPSVKAARPSGAVELDAVLHRAWSDEGAYPSAGAFARDLARVLTANPSSRGIPAVGGRTRPDAVSVKGDDARKQTLLGVIAQNADAFASKDMKSTLLGVGQQRAGGRVPPPVAPPKAPSPFTPPTPPVIPSPAAITPSGDPTRPRRTAEVTQRVEVPNIRPPGTEPVDVRPRPPAPALRPPRLADEPAELASATATAPLGSPTQEAAPAPPVSPVEAGTPPPPAIPTLTAGTPLLVPIPSDAPRPPIGERLSEPSWGSIEASLGDAFDDLALRPTEPPNVPRPVDAPIAPVAAVPVAEEAPVQRPVDPAAIAQEAFGVVTADAFDIVSDEDFAPVVPSPTALSAAPSSMPPALPIHSDEPAPQLPEVPVAIDAMPVAIDAMPVAIDVMPVVPELRAVPVIAPAPPIEPVAPTVPMEPVAPAQPVGPAPVAAPMPDVARSMPVPAPQPPSLKPSIPAWGPPPEPPPETDAALRGRQRVRRVALGLVGTLLGAGVIAAGFFFGRQTPTPAPEVPPTRPPALAADVPPASAPATRDAPAVAEADAAALAMSDAASDGASTTVAAADATSDAQTVAAVDAGATDDAASPVVAAPSDDAGTPLAVAAVDASAPAQPETGRRHHHPRDSEMDEVQDALQPDIAACITDARRRRHVHVAVRYEGATGRAVDIRVATSFAEPPMGPCIENVIRAHPLPPFINDSYEYRFSFESR